MHAADAVFHSNDYTLNQTELNWWISHTHLMKAYMPKCCNSSIQFNLNCNQYCETSHGHTCSLVAISYSSFLVCGYWASSFACIWEMSHILCNPTGIQKKCKRKMYWKCLVLLYQCHKSGNFCVTKFSWKSIMHQNFQLFYCMKIYSQHRSCF